MSTPEPVVTHPLRRMGGRDPHQKHRAATSLELLFDLTFVIGFAEAGKAFAHMMAEGHVLPAVLGFLFCTFAVCWGWINFTWFASAYDTDDWLYRLTTMAQMIGVLVVAMGVPDVFASFEHGGVFDNRTMILGYVIMRVPMIFQWLRAAKQDPPRRAAALSYAKSIAVTQLGWTATIFTGFTVVPAIGVGALLVILELAGPFLAERKSPTPWHAHHIAERYGLMIIITLGECLLGTVASLSAQVEHGGWTWSAIAVGLAGTLLTFGMWWLYGMLPSAEVLHRHRHKSFGWGYGHILAFGAIAATGAGLHVAAYAIEGHAHLSGLAVLLTVLVPIAVLNLVLAWLYGLLLGGDPLHRRILLLGAVLYAGVLGLAYAGVAIPICLLLLTLPTGIAIVIDERIGARHRAELLAQLHHAE